MKSMFCVPVPITAPLLQLGGHMAQGAESAVSKRKLQELAADVCPRQILDDDTEEVCVHVRE